MAEAKRRRRKPYIWAIEGSWSSRVRDVRSVDPVLRALKDAGVAEHARLHVNDCDDVKRALRRWGQAQHSRYKIGYLALHGSPGVVYAGKDPVDLFDVADDLPRGLLADKVLHLGSCDVLDPTEVDLKDLRKALGVKVLCGFTKYVPWFPGLAFELLLFDALTTYARPGNACNHLLDAYGDLADEVGFVMAT